MAVRQYIGARYVIKIYENSVDTSSAEWESTVGYEPLTMVTYNNSSYVSKKQVPNNIGNPADNPVYWVCTGYYNGQILSLQQQINNLHDQIDDIVELIGPSKKVIILSNSYGETPSASENFISKFAAMRPNDTVYYYAKSGSDFIGYSPNPTYADMITDHISVPDPEMITDIIVVGGPNDADVIIAGSATEAQLYTAIYNFLVACAPFVNAKIHITFCFANKADTSVYKTYQRIKTVYQLAVGQAPSTVKNQIVFHDFSLVLHEDGLIDATNKHPNSGGANVLSYAVASVLYGVPFHAKNVVSSSPTFTAAGIATAITVGSPNCQYNDGTGSLSTTNVSVTLNNETLTGGTVYTIATLSNTCLLGSYAAGSCITQALIGSNVYPVELWVENLQLKMRFLAEWGATVASGVSSIILYGINIMFNPYEG